MKSILLVFFLAVFTCAHTYYILPIVSHMVRISLNRFLYVLNHQNTYFIMQLQD